jgi:hypothetical protein
MSEDSRLKDVDLETPAYLIVAGPNSKPDVATLTSGSSVFVGSGSNCKIELVDDRVSQIQCMLWLEGNNVLKVQDWNTGTTFLNDAAVTDEIQMQSGDVLTVGSHRLTAVLDKEFHFGIAVELLNGDPSEPWQQQASVDLESAGSIAEPEPGAAIETVAVDESSFTAIESPEFSTTLPVEAPAVLKDKNAFAYDIDADIDDDETAGELDFSFNLAVDEFSSSTNELKGVQDNDELAMMRMELEQLQYELLDRDSKIQRLQEAQTQSRGEESLSETETLKLVTRLEDLLEELKSSDARINGLEELLRVSDHATEAEKEERQQLEQWVTEIEQRVGQREAEAQAEIGRLSKRLQDAKEESEHSATQLQSLATRGEDVSADQRAAVTALAEQVELLRGKLREAREENQELHQRATVADSEEDLPAKLKETTDELVRLKVEMSRERAETARRHAELEGIRDELEDRLKNARVVDPGDTRIRTMREHLREIHAREEAEKADNRTGGLGGRIANLLTRLR